MATNLHIDDALLADAMKLGKHKSKREAVNAALEHYRRALRAEGLIELFGTIEYDPGYDYKEERRRSTAKGLRKVGG
jgi:Arc/MetJ family transcription regulator